MTIPSLGTLTEANLREAWTHEALSFTPWLAANLDALANVIGIPLELEGVEVAVDTYAADILARNPQNDELVLIENQLEGTDHNHLGQLMTYLAGLDAKIVIWIAADFRDAHLSTVHWLNEHTIDPFAFFAIKLKVVRIGDSPLAPVFDVVARPNEWERQLQVIAKESRSTSDLSRFRRDFWTHFLERHPEDAIDGGPGSYANRYRTIEEMDLMISYYVAKNEVGLFIRGRRGAESDDVYAILEPYGEALAQRTESILRASVNGHYLNRALSADTKDTSRWDELADWLHEKLTLYTQALQELETDHGA